MTALVAAAAAGVGAGVLTAQLQGVLSADWNTIANSGAVWTVVTFALTALLARTQTVAMAAGMLALVGEVIGYYGWAAAVRHVPVTHAEELLWTMAALWIGPLVGLAAFHVRWGSARQRIVAAAAMAGVVAGEGLYLIRIAGVPRSGWVEVALAAAITGWLVAVNPTETRLRVAAVGAGGFTAAAVYVAYRLPMLG